MNQKQVNQEQINIEYEGQSYSVDADKIEGLKDTQILDLLSVGFPGMANGKLERLEDGSIKIIKRVGTKGSSSNSLIELLRACPEDDLALKIENHIQQLTEELTISQWSKIYTNLDFDKIQDILQEREELINSTLQRLSFCQTNIVPFV